MSIARVVRIAGSHRESDEMDVREQVSMSADQRRAIVRKLQRRFYGPNPPRLRVPRSRCK